MDSGFSSHEMCSITKEKIKFPDLVKNEDFSRQEIRSILDN